MVATWQLTEGEWAEQIAYRSRADAEPTDPEWEPELVAGEEVPPEEGTWDPTDPDDRPPPTHIEPDPYEPDHPDY